MNVNAKYLKDESNNIISPITSGETTYFANLPITTYIKYNKITDSNVYYDQQSLTAYACGTYEHEGYLYRTNIVINSKMDGTKVEMQIPNADIKFFMR